MKNIHILPTDKPSRLHKYNFEGFALSKETLNWKEAYNIYITSDEEIKIGDWVITPTNDIIEWAKVFHPIGKKIILTTNTKLIRYGVQAIDDEFLEWFVKNPSCEEVEVEMNQGRYFDYGGNVHITNAYKIIIPKEPKQEKLDFVYWLMDNCELITDSETQENVLWRYDSEDYTVEGLFKLFVDFSNPNAIKITKEEPKNICIQTGLPCGMQCFSEEACNMIKPKQETLQEVAERYSANELSQLGFINGAKWQQERSYSEEEVIQLLDALWTELDIWYNKKDDEQFNLIRWFYDSGLFKERKI